MSAPALGATVAKAAAPLVNWAGLGKVLVLAVATALIIGGGFSLGLAALDVYAQSREARQTRPGRTAVAAAPGGVRHASLVVAVVLFALCAGAVLIGLIEAPSSK